MKDKENKLGLMVVFLSPYLIMFIARVFYVRAFSGFNTVDSISKEAFDRMRFYIETGMNVFFAILYIYLGSLYYIMRRQKSGKNA